MKLFLVILTILSAVSGGATFAVPTSDSTLPDPFQFQDGRRVATTEDWRARRTEIVELISKIEYGHVPPAPGNVGVKSTLVPEEMFRGPATVQSVALSFGPAKNLVLRTDIYLPTDVADPLPAILRFGLGAEHAEAAMKRGYAFVCFEQTELDPDTEGHDVVGPAQAAYPDYDWGSIAVWAWGASRVLDHLETMERIDASKVVITGHSRTGKAALLAGALDERFAMVVPNGSGCGGAAVFRNPPKKVETLELITRASRFKSWFHADFGQFADREDALPFDQHFLRALVAPRPLLSTDAYGDQWCNPPGTQSAWEGAQPVFDFLGAGENNMIHFREGEHDQLAPDFAILLDVADHVLRGLPEKNTCRDAPFPEAKLSLPWRAPGSDGAVAE